MPKRSATQADVTQSPTGEKADENPNLSSADESQSSGDAKSHEQLVQEAAYRRFLERGGEHGKHEDDWYAAEQEVKPPDGN